ncbi:MAG: AAA family ATPase [Nitrospiraceae bacterium]|nr:AAA family ATPase [Nitrospiraceae bacterium]
MSFVIGFAGKGGTGKTSLAGLTVRYLAERKRGPVLAVDADSNSCLNEALGVDVHATIGRLREESLTAVRAGGARPGGMSMEELFDYQVQQSIIESEGFDLLVMGRPEGPGCYCAANNIIRKYTDKLSDDYPYVVIDNEAGMEHLSRKTTHKVDLLLVVSDASKKGIYTARRISALVDELKLDVDKQLFIINRAPAGHEKELRETARELGVEAAGIIPEDRNLFDNDMQGVPVLKLPADSPALKAFYSLLDGLNIP